MAHSNSNWGIDRIIDSGLGSLVDNSTNERHSWQNGCLLWLCGYFVLKISHSDVE